MFIHDILAQPQLFQIQSTLRHGLLGSEGNHTVIYEWLTLNKKCARSPLNFFTKIIIYIYTDEMHFNFNTYILYISLENILPSPSIYQITLSVFYHLLTISFAVSIVS